MTNFSIKVLFKTEDEIALFLSTWVVEDILFKKMEEFLKQLKKQYKFIYVFLIPWWYKDGTPHLKLLKKYVHRIDILANSLDQFLFYKLNQENTIFCNQNCWLDENIFKPISLEKEYDLVINSNNNKWKNHHLLEYINKKYKTLFITYPVNKENDLKKYNPAKIIESVPPVVVAQELNKCKIGLSLSSVEGSCYATTEYLLCGLPVISLKSLGGRHVWYNEKNSILINEDEKELLFAIETILSNYSSYNCTEIRDSCIKQQQNFRCVFINYLNNIFPNHNMRKIVDSSFSNRMLHSVSMDNLDLDYIIRREICKTV